MPAALMAAARPAGNLAIAPLALMLLKFGPRGSSCRTLSVSMRSPSQPPDTGLEASAALSILLLNVL